MNDFQPVRSSLGKKVVVLYRVILYYQILNLLTGDLYNKSWRFAYEQ